MRRTLIYPFAHVLVVPNEREDRVLQRYKADGWVMLRGGAPDFIALKVVDGKIVDDMAVEVKSPEAELTYEQAIFRQFLERHGVEYKVEVEK